MDLDHIQDHKDHILHNKVFHHIGHIHHNKDHTQDHKVLIHLNKVIHHNKVFHHMDHIHLSKDLIRLSKDIHLNRVIHHNKDLILLSKDIYLMVDFLQDQKEKIKDMALSKVFIKDKEVMVQDHNNQDQDMGNNHLKDIHNKEDFRLNMEDIKIDLRRNRHMNIL